MTDLNEVRKQMHMVTVDEMKVGDTAYFNPAAEMFATPDQKIWLSKRHDMRTMASEYHCGKLELTDSGAQADLGECLQKSKQIVTTDSRDARDESMRLPLAAVTGWRETASARALERAKALEQNEGINPRW